MTVYKCDKCGKEIPYVKKNYLGIDVEVLDRGYVNSTEWDISHLFYDFDLCKDCAKEISLTMDNIFLKLKLCSRE